MSWTERYGIDVVAFAQNSCMNYCVGDGGQCLYECCEEYCENQMKLNMGGLYLSSLLITIDIFLIYKVVQQFNKENK